MPGRSVPRQYDTLILDEAHERSLNIDFPAGFTSSGFCRSAAILKLVTPRQRSSGAVRRDFGLAARPGARDPGDRVAAYPVEIRFVPWWRTKEENDPTWRRGVRRRRRVGPQRGGDIHFMPRSADIQRLAAVLGEREVPRRSGRAKKRDPAFKLASIASQQRVFEPLRTGGSSSPRNVANVAHGPGIRT